MIGRGIVGDIVINANCYAKEADSPVSKEEFLSFAENNEFQLVLAGNPYVRFLLAEM